MRGEHPPTLEEDAENALQDAHLAYLATLHERGHLVAAGPLMGPVDRKLRGLSLFIVEPDEAQALANQDPAVRAGKFALQVVPWMVPRGAIRFDPVRFPHSGAEADAE